MWKLDVEGKIIKRVSDRNLVLCCEWHLLGYFSPGCLRRDTLHLVQLRKGAWIQGSSFPASVTDAGGSFSIGEECPCVSLCFVTKGCRAGGCAVRAPGQQQPVFAVSWRHPVCAWAPLLSLGERLALQGLLARTSSCLLQGAGLPLPLGFKTEPPAFCFLKKDRHCGCKEKLSAVQSRAEEGRREENLAAWIAWTALSGFMTPAV